MLYYDSTYVRYFKVVKFMETMMGAKGWGEGRMGSCGLKVIEFQFCKMRNF